MSRLYIKSKSDTHQTENTLTGNEVATTTFFYGSKKDSKKALNIQCVYTGNDENDKPIFFITHNEGVTVRVAPFRV